MNQPSELPIYLQIEAQLRQNIQEDVWPPHFKLPDEMQLSKELGVSRGTLRKAIKNLVSEGMLSQIKGKGTFVLDRRIEQPLASRLISFSEAMHELHMDFHTEVLRKERVVPNRKVAAFLALTGGERAAFLERIRLVDNRPVIYLQNYVCERYCPDILDSDFERVPLFDIIERQYGIQLEWGRRCFKAVAANENIAFNLGLPLGAPVMYLEQISYAKDNVAVEYSDVYINSERFEIASVLTRR